MRLSSLLPLAVEGIYFYVPSGGKDKCFGEEAAPDQVIHVNYKHENQHGVICQLSFLDSKGRVLLQQPLSQVSGSVAAMIPSNSPGGMNQICLKCPGSRWTENEPQKFTIKIDVGGRSLLDAGDSFANKDQVRSMETRARELIDRVEVIESDNEYERMTEARWRDSSESVNSSIQTISIISIGLILAVSVLQLIVLRSYFKKEKIIF
jgi:hypothetical protein